MKKTVLIFVIAVLVLLTVILWFVYGKFTLKIEEALMIGGLVIILAFAIFQGLERLKNARRKEAVEDELSRKLLTNASLLAFYISIYFWLFMMYISDKTVLESHSLIGGGILGVAVIFFLCWAGLRIFGFKNE